MSCVVITGSSKGFGYSLAYKFKELGHNIVISATNQERLDIALNKLSSVNKDNTSVISVIADVRKENDLDNLYLKAIEVFGSVDIWINNAGVNQPDKPAYELSSEEIDFMIDTDLKGTINGSKVAFKYMMKQGYGQIYNVEGYGSNDAMMMGLSIYGTTKRAVTYFTQALAKESKELTNNKVKVCRLTPGIMITDFLNNANGGKTTIELPEKTKKIYNILGDYPETIVNYLVPKMIKNKKNNACVIWLSNKRAFGKFLKACFKKNDYFNK